MILNQTLFKRVIDDLESNGAIVVVIAKIINDKVDYIIKAEFPDGKKWEIVEIKDLIAEISVEGYEIKDDKN